MAVDQQNGDSIVQIGGVIDNYNIERIREIYCKRFNHTGTEYKIKFHTLPNDLVQLDKILYDSIDAILKLVLINRNIYNTYIRVVINHPILETPIQTDYENAKDMTTAHILTEIAKVAQSKKELHLDEHFTFYSSIIELPTGAGNDRYENYADNLKSLVQIKNKDNSCALRAIAIGMAHADWKAEPNNSHLRSQYQQIIHKRSPKQRNKA